MPSSSITCLVVESDSLRAEQILEYLKASDSSELLCLCAQSWSEAKRKLVRTKIDLVISKGVLPEADHMDVLARFRKSDEEPVILCLLEDEEQSVILDASKDGADDYLFYKDLGQESLLEAIRHAFDRRELLAELKSVQSVSVDGKAVYRGLLHCLDAALFLVSRPEGELIFNNKVADTWFGGSKDSVLVDLFEYGVLEADAIEMEITTQTAAIPISELRSVQVEWKGRDCSLITLRNISKRKRAEEAYRSSQRRLDLAIKASNVGMWSWDLRENKLHFSERWKAQIGYKSSEFPNTLAAFKDHLHFADLTDVEQLLSQALRGEISEIYTKYRMRHKDGDYRWMLCRAECFPDESGRLSSLVGSHIDVTESETGARKANFETSLGAKLGVRMERIAAEIEGKAKRLKESFRGDSVIVQRIQELERLSSSFACLNQVLQLESPSGDSVVSRLALGSEVEELHRSQAGLLPSKGEIVVEVKDEIHLHGFSQRNLFFALTEAYVCVRDSVTPDFNSRIHVSVFRDPESGGAACVQYRYYGKPVGNSELLALAKTPGIEVESSGGLATAELRIVFGAGERKKSSSGSGRPLALLAEDEGVLRLAIHTMLESIGYEVVVAKDGEEAIEAYSRRKSDLEIAFVDMQMPHVDGLGVVASIRSADDELPIVLMSGDSQDEGADRVVLEDERSTFLSKPFGISELKTGIEEISGHVSV